MNSSSNFSSITRALALATTLFMWFSQSLGLSDFWDSDVRCFLASSRESLSVLVIVSSYV